MKSQTDDLTRHAVIIRIRAALKTRSSKAWSVTGGRGTAYGWITITAPPARLGTHGGMTDDDLGHLAELLDLDSVHHQGVKIPASSDYYREYLDRAEGRTPSKIAEPYWD